MKPTLSCWAWLLGACALAPVCHAEGLRADSSIWKSTALLVSDFSIRKPEWVWWSAPGQLRASTGLVVANRPGPRGLLGADGPLLQQAMPYVGIGYSDESFRSGWRVSADVGLVAESLGALSRGGRVLLGAQGLDSLLRELRLSPHIQLGVRYAF
jgi:hypothetical protein